ncbi:hypothetical protein Tco_0950800 [Tanacetum coccineum]
MIGSQVLCSFFVSDDNIEFLEQKDPPHQSWLSGLAFLFSEENYMQTWSVYTMLMDNRDIGSEITQKRTLRQVAGVRELA